MQPAVADADAAEQRGPRRGEPPSRTSWRHTVEQARATPAPGSQPTGRQRPPAPWHPLPLAEVLIVAGAVGFLYGVLQGPSGKTPLLLGIAATAVGTIEFTLREHLGGFRSHTVLLSLLPAVVFHTAVVLLVSSSGHVSPALNLALVVVDLAIFFLLFRILRMRFLRAQHRAASATRSTRS